MADYNDGDDADNTPDDQKKVNAPQVGAGDKSVSSADDIGVSKPTLKDGSVPPELRYVGLVVSSFMILGGFYAVLHSARLYGVAILLICVGFGIMLAAFGAQAEGRIFKFNVVGGGALAVLLYLLLVKLPITPSENYVRGRIEQTGAFKEVLGAARSGFFVGRPRKDSDFEFVIFEREMDSTQFYFYFLFPDGAATRELYIGCIDTDIARQLMGSNEELVFSLEARGGEQYQLIDNKSAKQVGQVNKTRCASGEPNPIPPMEISLWNSFIGLAFAQSSEIGSVQRAVLSLDAEDGAERDFARSAIGQLSTPDAFQVVADTWDIAESSYRADLGRLVGWADAISRDRKTAVQLARSLSRAQLEYLVQITGQGDFTLRQFATQVLQSLLETTRVSAGLPKEKADEVISAVVAGLRDYDFRPVAKNDVSFSSSNRYYNTLISIEFSGCNIGETYRDEVSRQLGRAISMVSDNRTRTKTFNKIREIRETLAACKN